MFREMRKSLPRDPKYADGRGQIPVELPLHVHVPRLHDAFRNRGSTVTGASPAGRAVSRALASAIDPVAVNGTPNGGLLAVSLTAVVTG